MNKQKRKNFIWNLIGGSVYALTATLMGTMTMRFLGDAQAGILLFALATIGQHIYTTACFGMRPVQITDTDRKFSFGDYRHFRIITCTAAFALALIFALIYARNDSVKMAVIIIMCLFKCIDGMCDCYEAEFQRNGRLDLTGKSCTFRTLAAWAVYLMVLTTSKNLIWACISATLIYMVSWFVMCSIPLKSINECDYTAKKDNTKPVFDAGKWLFISSFIDLYILFASKYAIDAFKSAEISGYYAVIFLPASLINVASYFIVRPVLTELSDDYASGMTAHFRQIMKRLCIVAGALTAAGVIAAFLLGIPVITLIVGKTSGVAIAEYKTALALIVLGGGIYAILNIFYYALVIFGRQKSIFKIYLAGAAIASVTAFPASYLWGINGAAVSFVLTIALTTALFVREYGKRIR